MDATELEEATFPGNWLIKDSTELEEDELDELMEEELSESGELMSELYESGELTSDSSYLSNKITNRDSGELWSDFFFLNPAPLTPVAIPVTEDDIHNGLIPTAQAVTWAWPLEEIVIDNSSTVTAIVVD